MKKIGLMIGIFVKFGKEKYFRFCVMLFVWFFLYYVLIKKIFKVGVIRLIIVLLIIWLVCKLIVVIVWIKENRIFMMLFIKIVIYGVMELSEGFIVKLKMMELKVFMIMIFFNFIFIILLCLENVLFSDVRINGVE